MYSHNQVTDFSDSYTGCITNYPDEGEMSQPTPKGRKHVSDEMLYQDSECLSRPSPSKKRYFVSSQPAENTTFLQSTESNTHVHASPIDFAYSLETVKKPQVLHTAFQSIDASTLANLIRNMTSEMFKENYVLIDCRYPYEYEGGHVKHAVNIHNPDDLNALFYPVDRNGNAKSIGKVPIFYCEFSQKRGPQMASKLRNEDRTKNLENYPVLDYPEIYLLNFGYRSFFHEDSFKDLCEPAAYVPMLDSNFTTELTKFSEHKRDSRKRRQRKIRFDV